jgi:tetratricopeptide (TPR) repeat protein
MAYSARANQESAKPDGDNQQIVKDLQAAIDAMSGFLEGARFGEKRKPWDSSDPTEMSPEGVLLSRAETMIALANELVAEQRGQLYTSALADCDRILEIADNPLELARAHFSRGHAKRMVGELDEAIESYTKAVQQFPTYTEAYLRRGICYYHQGAYEEALQDFVAASTDPRDPFQLESRAMFWSGLTHAKQGEHQQAVRDYTRAIEASPDYVPAYLNRGLSYMNAGRYDQAIEDFNSVLRRKRDHEHANRYREIALQRRDAESSLSGL